MKLNELQVKAYDIEWPEDNIAEVAMQLEMDVTPEKLRDMLVYVAKLTDKIGWTLEEIANYEE